MSNLPGFIATRKSNRTIPHDLGGQQKPTALRKHLLKAIGQIVLNDLSPLSNPEPWRPKTIKVELVVERHPGELTLLKCGERGLVLGTPEQAFKARAGFVAPGDTIYLEVAYHVDPALPHHAEPHGTVRIIDATAWIDYSDAEHPWLVPISPGVREFLREIVSDELEARDTAA